MALIFRNAKGSSLTYTEMDENIRLLYSASVYNATGSGGASSFPFTGSAIVSGSLIITGSLFLSGSFNGTASNANTASYVLTSQTASYVASASYARTASFYGGSVTSASYSSTSSYVINAISASYVLTSQTASFYGGSVTSASYASTASSILGTTNDQIDLTNLGTVKGPGFVFPTTIPANPKQGSAYVDMGGVPNKLYVFDGSVWKSTDLN